MLFEVSTVTWYAALEAKDEFVWKSMREQLAQWPDSEAVKKFAEALRPECRPKSTMSRRALALAVTTSVRRYRKQLNFGC